MSLKQDPEDPNHGKSTMQWGYSMVLNMPHSAPVIPSEKVFRLKKQLQIEPEKVFGAVGISIDISTMNPSHWKPVSTSFLVVYTEVNIMLRDAFW